MQIVTMNRDVAGAVLLAACIPERQFEQDLPGVPLSTGESVRVNADLAQSMICIQMMQHLHDIRRHVNAGAYPLERLSLLVNANLKTLALQQGGSGGPTKPCSNDGNVGPALHESHADEMRKFLWTAQSKSSMPYFCFGPFASKVGLSGAITQEAESCRFTGPWTESSYYKYCSIGASPTVT